MTKLTIFIWNELVDIRLVVKFFVFCFFFFPFIFLYFMGLPEECAVSSLAVLQVPCVYKHYCGQILFLILIESNGSYWF